MRQLFILATILFCTNSQCSTLQTLLTEVTLCYGGTQELIKVLNRIGATTSLDTSQRIATHVVETRIIKGMVPELNERALSIVLIDNIDILQTHAFVSSTDKSRSWHGTSVQYVQPLPVTGILTEDELFRPTHESVHRKHSLTNSPTSCPVLVQKTKRRKRTLAESPHSTLAVRGNCTSQQQLPPLCDDTQYSVPTRNLGVQDFRQNLPETQAWKLLADDIHMCMLLKHGVSDSSHLPSLQSLFNCVCEQSQATEESRVAYVQISSERADSKSTLITILSKMYETFVVEQNQKWLIVVGDAKTYDILRSIRTEYGEQMKWLIPWPGDWHILL